MSEEEKKAIEADIADTIMERPQGFLVSGRRFYLYPATLGKSYLVFRLVGSLGIDTGIAKANSYMEALRLCHEKKGTVCRILAYHTINRKEELFDADTVKDRCDFFARELDDESMARLLITVLAGTDMSRFITHLGIDRERERLAKAMEAKNDSGSSTFGGKSIYGTLIGPACERYGWTFEYVVWGISYANLQMLLADSMTSVYLSDEERKRAHIPGREAIDADDPANAARIAAMIQDGT